MATPLGTEAPLPRHAPALPGTLGGLSHRTDSQVVHLLREVARPRRVRRSRDSDWLVAACRLPGAHEAAARHRTAPL